MQNARTELEMRLGKEISDLVWEILQDDYQDLLDAAMGTGDDEAWEDVIRTVKPLSKANSSSGKYVASPVGRGMSQEQVIGKLSDYEEERSQIFSEYVARLASRTSYVRKFRDRYLGGEVVSSEQAYNILRSPITAHHSRLAFREWEASIPNHTYSQVERVVGDEVYIRYALDSSKEKPLRVLDKRPYEAGSWYIGGSSKTFRGLGENRREVRDYLMLRFPAEDGTIHSVFAKKGSVLGDFHRTITRLLKDHPWFEPDALWFLLTGTTPYVAPLTIRGKQKGREILEPPEYSPLRFEYGFMSITVEPWISADTVKRAFVEYQKRWLGGDNRPIREKNRQLFTFVSEWLSRELSTLEPSAKDKRKVGKALVPEWDLTYPSWAYGSNSHDFWRDYAAARKRIATPTYRYFKD